MRLGAIDGGAEFDFGRASLDYGRYRDIYPASLYEGLRAAGIGLAGQRVLDLGTGTGPVPRALAGFGARFTGVDASAAQIAEARRLSAESGVAAEYLVAPAEDTGLPSGTFDAVTAVQCFLYFDRDRALAEIARLLVPRGLFATVWMAWITRESEIAAETERLVLSYNPLWQGKDYARASPDVPEWSLPLFERVACLDYVAQIPFTRESWRGRIRACRGVAATLPDEAVAAFDAEHARLLERSVPERFEIPHHVLAHVFRKRATA